MKRAKSLVRRFSRNDSVIEIEYDTDEVIYSEIVYKFEVISGGAGFHTNISGYEAETLLKENGRHGSFLFRKSDSSPGAYTLSVRCEQSVFHYKIRNDGDSFELYEGDGFASIPALILFYQNNPQCFLTATKQQVKLISPLQQEVKPNGPHFNKPWFAGCISSSEAEKQLKTDGLHGSFCVRESRSQPGNFVLSVRGGNDVFEFLISNLNNMCFLASDPKKQFDSLQQLLDYYGKHPLTDKRSEEMLHLVEPLAETVTKAKLDAKIKLEFEELQRNAKVDAKDVSEGLKKVNHPKNRYNNILPFDHNRVKLKDAVAGVDGSDYINASRIKFDETDSCYIACQGCLSKTVQDFWQMVCQENTRIIMMLTNEVELGKIKCVKYWPDPGTAISLGNKQIMNTKENHTRDFIVRELQLVDINVGKKPAKPPRNIFHYQYIAWPDHGVPRDPGSLLDMLESANKLQESFESPGPAVLHCSAGIGRTGTILALDIALSMVKQRGGRKDINVDKIVAKLRQQRCGLIQTEEQYRFVYTAISHSIEAEKKRSSMVVESKVVYGNIAETTNSLDRKRAIDRFQSLRPLNSTSRIKDSPGNTQSLPRLDKMR